MIFRARALVVTTVVAASVLTLSGCSSGPSRDEVAERYAIELDAVMPGASEATGADDLIAHSVDDAFAGRCGEDAYYAQIAEAGEFATRPWNATCLMYFEDDMSDAQVERAKR